MASTTAISSGMATTASAVRSGSRSRARMRRALWPTGPTGTALRRGQRDLQERQAVAGGGRVHDR